MAEFYSYMWLREDGTPYYVGKGCGRRAFRHNRPPYPPKDKTRVLVFPMLSEAEAFESEIALVDLFGRKCDGGCLLNLALGGEGYSGHVVSAEQKEILRMVNLGNTYGRANKGWKGHPGNQFRLGIPHSDETKQKISDLLRGNTYRSGTPHTEETKQHLSDVLRGRPKSEQTRKNMTDSWTPERRARRAEETRHRMEEKFIKTVAWG